MGSEIVVLKTYPGEAAALVDRAVLEANKIPSMISSDGSSSMEPQLQFVQGVRLMVHESDATAARELLEVED